MIFTQQCVPPRSFFYIYTHIHVVSLTSPTFLGLLGNMDVRSVEDWSKGARDAAVLDSRRQQQSPSVLERGGEQQLEESRYEPGLTLVDSGSDHAPGWLSCSLLAPARHTPPHPTTCDTRLAPAPAPTKVRLAAYAVNFDDFFESASHATGSCD